MFLASLYRSAVVAVVLIGTHVRSAEAQGAWVGDEKSLEADLSYHFVPATATAVTPDISVPDRPITNHVFTLSAEYVPIQHLAIEALLPLEMMKYTGTAPHLPPGKWDDGSFHTTLTDFRLGARYQVLDEPMVAVSPYVAVSIPVMDYEVNGFATGGRHLKELHFGTSLGRSLDPILPHLVISGTYELTVAEHYNANPQTEKIGQAHSDIDAQIGYFLLDGDLMLNVAGNWRIAHGGVDFTRFPMLPAEITMFHDPILREEFIFVGGGVSYAINSTITVGAVARFFLQGSNTRDQNLYGVDVSWKAL